MSLQRCLLIGALSLGSAAFIGCESTEQLGGSKNPQLAAMDNTFFRNAAIGDMTEIQSSRIAVQRGTDPAVKQFAQMMIADHTNNSSKLSQLATKKGVSPVKELDTPHAAVVNGLPEQPGKEFDRAYMAAQVTAHEETVTNFERAASDAKDPEVKAYANQALPMLRHHLQMAKDVRDKL
jgi:putative membrane protein